MKIIKIFLAAIVVGLVLFFIINSIVNTTQKDEVLGPMNQFIEKINQEVITLEKFSNNNLQDDTYTKYNEIKFDIEDYYSTMRLGKNQVENDHMKEILSKNLYSVYSNKFIEQTYYVLENSDWKQKDLIFIKNELRVLKNSKFLERESKVDGSLNVIQSALDKYDEIALYIESCKGFNFYGDDLSDKFPLSVVDDKIDTMKTYKSNNLENFFVNKCARLHAELDKVPQYLFNAHYKFLENKFNKSTGLYRNFGSQRDYVNNFYLLLRNELDDLDNDIYEVSDFDEKHNKLIKILDDDSRDAYNYFSNATLKTSFTAPKSN